MLWDSVQWDFVLWDFVRRGFVLWDFVLWDFFLWDSVRIPLRLCGGRILRGSLSMTEVYTKCTALFTVRRRTPARCK